MTLSDLPAQQRKVAELAAKGLRCQQIAERIGIDQSTVRGYILRISYHIPNPDEITPFRLVMLWASRQIAA